MNKSLVFAFSIVLCSGALASEGVDPKEQVDEALALSDPVKQAVAEFASKAGRLPASNAEAGLADAHQWAVRQKLNGQWE